MGQIADDMINGCACQLCGCYFTDDDEGIYQHDIPVVCFDCWEELDSEERMYYTRAVKSTL